MEATKQEKLVKFLQAGRGFQGQTLSEEDALRHIGEYEESARGQQWAELRRQRATEVAENEAAAAA